MPKQVPEKRPRTFPQFVRVLEEFQKRSEAAWYRGCSKSNHKLIPTLYRHPKKRSLKDLTALEDQLMTRFRQRSLPFHSHNFSSVQWDLLFFMQHYGIPTRLLDWTENPFIGLYFALMTAKATAKGRFTQDVAFWMLDPVRWNRGALSHQSFDGGILYERSKEINSYQPGSDIESMTNYPVMMYGSHNSTRIVAQRGVFAIFGKDVRAMEDVYQNDAFASGCLVKVVIEKDFIDFFKTSLLAKGITESVVFPDLIGLAQEIRREYGFGQS